MLPLVSSPMLPPRRGLEELTGRMSCHRQTHFPYVSACWCITTGCRPCLVLSTYRLLIVRCYLFLSLTSQHHRYGCGRTALVSILVTVAFLTHEAVMQVFTVFTFHSSGISDLCQYYLYTLNATHVAVQVILEFIIRKCPVMTLKVGYYHPHTLIVLCYLGIP